MLWLGVPRGDREAPCALLSGAAAEIPCLSPASCSNGLPVPCHGDGCGLPRGALTGPRTRRLQHVPGCAPAAAHPYLRRVSTQGWGGTGGLEGAWRYLDPKTLGAARLGVGVPPRAAVWHSRGPSAPSHPPPLRPAAAASWLAALLTLPPWAPPRRRLVLGSAFGAELLNSAAVSACTAGLLCTEAQLSEHLPSLHHSESPPGTGSAPQAALCPSSCPCPPSLGRVHPLFSPTPQS